MQGARDEIGLKAALSRPPQHWAHAHEPDLADLAASYAFGLCRNHPYLDGNKRIALVTMVVFLRLNGSALAASEEEVVAVMLELADGTLREANLAAWIREHQS